ncbi:hypothetical protein P3T43_006704 [Paraburkholderia sp. GAS41]|jgi:hypothetical protein
MVTGTKKSRYGHKVHIAHEPYFAWEEAGGWSRQRIKPLSSDYSHNSRLGSGTTSLPSEANARDPGDAIRLIDNHRADRFALLH